MGHHHHHHAGAGDHGRAWALWIALALNGGYALVEAVGGWYSGSLALVADAGHMLTDVGALGLSLFAVWFAKRPADDKRTFGYLRIETVAALINALLLVGLCGYVIIESLLRLFQPSQVFGTSMLVIAAGGLLVNGVSAWLLHGNHDDDLNARGAYLHLLSDALGSIAVIAAAGLIAATGWNVVDPLTGIGISVLIIWNTWQLLGETIHVLLQGVPGRISLPAVEAALRRQPLVADVHDLHVWTLGAGREILTAHVVLAGGASAEQGHGVLVALSENLRREFNIQHTTIQLESASIAHCGQPEHDHAMADNGHSH